MRSQPTRRPSIRLSFLVPSLVAMLFMLSSPSLAGEKGKKSNADVSKEFSEAYDAMKSYGYEKKEAFLAWAEKRSNDLQEEIEELDARIEKSNAEIRSELMEARRHMQKEKRELAKSMKGVRKSSEEAWEDAKWGMSAALAKLEQAYDRALSRFRDAEKQNGAEKE